MIPVENPIAEPDGFDEHCRRKGKAWLAENPDARRPTDLWSPFRLALADGFVDRCGYGSMYIASGTVDHFVSCHEDKEQAYEWSNYRYLANWVNSSKSKKTAVDFLDPFEIREGWFEISLPSLQMVMTEKLPENLREKARYTLENLPIRDDERIIRARREWLRMYRDNELSLEGLRKKAPLIAAAVEKELLNARHQSG